MNQQNNKRLIRIKEVMELTGLTRSTVYTYINNGQFPKHAKFGNSSLWEYNEIQEWINLQLAKRDRQKGLTKKEIKSDNLEEATAKFIANGGEIKVLPYSPDQLITE